jgi:hypothetical protein
MTTTILPAKSIGTECKRPASTNVIKKLRKAASMRSGLFLFFFSNIPRLGFDLISPFATLRPTWHFCLLAKRGQQYDTS